MASVAVEMRPATLTVLSPHPEEALGERLRRLRERVVELPSAGSCIVPHESPLGQILAWQSIVLGAPLAPSGLMRRPPGQNGLEAYYLVPLEVAECAISASTCLMRHALPPRLQRAQDRSE